jgi:hypothetical protein
LQTPSQDAVTVTGVIALTGFVEIANPISGLQRSRTGPTKVALPLALGTGRLPELARSARRRPVLVPRGRLREVT